MLLNNRKHLRMRYIDRKKKLDYLLEMIKKGRCLSAVQVSMKLDCSSRTVKRMISELKEDGHSITYCKYTKKYFLENQEGGQIMSL